MPGASTYHYDAASLAAIGRRELQEDAVAIHFPKQSGFGYIVLADGMGGHAAGDIASKMVVQEFFDELHVHAKDPDHLERHIGTILHDALDRANQRVSRHAAKWPDRRGMGTTLVAPLIIANRLYWISVGDSPLYLLRGNRLSRLNQEHSMAQRLDRLAQSGAISAVEAEQNPDRHCLTSVLLGEDVAEIDCRDRPLDLAHGDILIAASDGILFLDEVRIAALVYENRDRTSAEIGERLLREISDHDDPNQDNVSLCLVKVSTAAVEARHCENPAPPAKALIVPRRLTVQMQARRTANRVSHYFASEREG